MVNKAFLKDIKSGDFVVRSIVGGGYTSYSVAKIEHVDKKGIFIEGADGNYEADSECLFSTSDGKSVNNYIPGFYSCLMRLATEADKLADEEGEEIKL